MQHRLTVTICTLLLGAFAALSWSAAQTKNSTVDEPGHALSGWLMWRYGDFRLAPENPSLWQLWAALPNVGREIQVHFDGKVFSDESFDSQGGINWVGRTLYQTPGNDGEQLVRRSRMMMLILGVLLGAVIGVWSYQLGGSVAAMVAVGLFSFDPNFLAHSAVVKSDVALSLVMLALGYSTWQLGRRATAFRALAVGVLCGLGMNAKFSGLLLLPMLGVMLGVRAMLPTQWNTRRGSVNTRVARLLLAAGVCTFAVFICFTITWAAYGFRFRPAVSVTARMDMSAIRAHAILLEAGASTDPPHKPEHAELAAWKPSLIVRSVDFADAHRLLPQAMLGGLLYQHACMQVWPSYLMGRLYGIGRWYYFPLAMLFKTPLGTLVAIGLSLLMLPCYRRRWSRALVESNESAWPVVCLFVPFAMFGVAALQSHLDIGIRSILPLYPVLFVGIGVHASRVIQLRRRLTVVALVLLAVTLLTETLSAWPNYISFFNTAAGGQRGGFALLGDSNLDWGQDLKPLVKWHRDHPGVPIYLHYFGVPDPRFFSPDFHLFEFTPDGRPVSDVPVRGGVLAISANFLQGLYDKPEDQAFYQRIGSHPPDEIVGGSIYLYRLKP
jgi:hypothetical protein